MTNTISLRSFDNSIYLTGYSMIFIYLLFHLASFAPFITRDFYLVKFNTSFYNTLFSVSFPLVSISAFFSKSYMVNSTWGCLSS